MTICPNCGFRHGGVDFGSELLDLRLGPIQRTVLTKIVAARQGIVSREAIISAVYDGCRDVPDDLDNTIYQAITRIKRKMAGSGYRIVVHRNVGYKLERAP